MVLRPIKFGVNNNGIAAEISEWYNFLSKKPVWDTDILLTQS